MCDEVGDYGIIPRTRRKPSDLLFPFTEDVPLDMGKLIPWRIQTIPDFGSTWLSDYVLDYLGGLIQRGEQTVEMDMQMQ